MGFLTPAELERLPVIPDVGGVSMKRTSFLLFSALGILLSWLTTNGLAQSIQPGTEIKVRLVDQLDTNEAQEGQFFSATLAEPVSFGNKKVLARGTRIKGQVTEKASSARPNRPASITLILTSIDNTQIQTEPLQIDDKSHLVRNAAQIAEGAAARAGTGTAFVAGKQEIVLPSETELDFVVADRTAPSTKTPEPVVERNIEHTPESKPAIWRADSPEDTDDAYDALIFSDRDKWLIHSYFQSNYGNLPPGLITREGHLPPGLEKHLHPDEILPPTLQNRVEPLPEELERQLPRLPFGYSRVVLSGRVIVLAGDNQIVDLMFIYR
jgi:hypothetical protein